MFAEYVGIEQDVASAIEAGRENASETKNDILRRIFREWGGTKAAAGGTPPLDFGQGIRLPIGERLYLYLSKPNGVGQKPDGIADVKDGGLYLGDRRITPSHGSVITPAMKEIQRQVGHVNQNGDLISLSAYRQWHVIRGGQLVPLDRLKDPAQRRTRTPKASKVDVDALLKELGIE